MEHEEDCLPHCRISKEVLVIKPDKSRKSELFQCLQFSSLYIYFMISHSMGPQLNIINASSVEALCSHSKKPPESSLLFWKYDP